MESPKPQPIYILNPALSADHLNELFYERLEQLDALACVALCDGFMDQRKDIIYCYLSHMREYVDTLRELHHAILETLSKHVD